MADRVCTYWTFMSYCQDHIKSCMWKGFEWSTIIIQEMLIEMNQIKIIYRELKY